MSTMIDDPKWLRFVDTAYGKQDRVKFRMHGAKHRDDTAPLAMALHVLMNMRRRQNGWPRLYVWGAERVGDAWVWEWRTRTGGAA